MPSLNCSAYASGGLEIECLLVRGEEQMRDRPYSEGMSEQLRADPAYAAVLLADVLREGSPAELAILLQQLTLTFGTQDQPPHARSR